MAATGNRGAGSGGRGRAWGRVGGGSRASARPWEGAGGISCGPGWSCGCGFKGVAALVPPGPRLDALEARPVGWRPTPVPGEPGSRLGLTGRRRGERAFAALFDLGSAGSAVTIVGAKGCQRVTLEVPRFEKCWGLRGGPARSSRRAREKVLPARASTPRRCCSSAPSFSDVGDVCERCDSAVKKPLICRDVFG